MDEQEYTLQNKHLVERMVNEGEGDTVGCLKWSASNGAKVSASVSANDALNGKVTEQIKRVHKEMKAREALPEMEKITEDMKRFHQAMTYNCNILRSNWSLLCNLVFAAEGEDKKAGQEMLKDLLTEPPIETPWSKIGRDIEKEYLARKYPKKT